MVTFIENPKNVLIAQGLAFGKCLLRQYSTYLIDKIFSSEDVKLKVLVTNRDILRGKKKEDMPSPTCIYNSDNNDIQESGGGNDSKNSKEDNSKSSSEENNSMVIKAETTSSASLINMQKGIELFSTHGIDGKKEEDNNENSKDNNKGEGEKEEEIVISLTEYVMYQTSDMFTHVLDLIPVNDKGKHFLNYLCSLNRYSCNRILSELFKQLLMNCSFNDNREKTRLIKRIFYIQDQGCDIQETICQKVEHTTANEYYPDSNRLLLKFYNTELGERDDCRIRIQGEYQKYELFGNHLGSYLIHGNYVIIEYTRAKRMKNSGSFFCDIYELYTRKWECPNDILLIPHLSYGLWIVETFFENIYSSKFEEKKGEIDKVNAGYICYEEVIKEIIRFGTMEHLKMLVIILSEPSILIESIKVVLKLNDKSPYSEDIKVKKYLLNGYENGSYNENTNIKKFHKSLSNIFQVFEDYNKYQRAVPIKYKLCGEIKIHYTNIINDEIPCTRFFEPILKDTTAKSFQEYFRYFIPFHKYFICNNNDDETKNKSLKESLVLTAWINSVYQNDYIRIQKCKGDSKFIITSILSGKLDVEEKDINYEDISEKVPLTKDFVCLYKFDMENKIDIKHSFTFIIDSPSRIPAPFVCITYSKDRIITSYSSDNTKTYDEMQLPQFSFALLLNKNLIDRIEEYELNLSVVCIHKHESKMSQKQIEKICNSIGEGSDNLFNNMKKIRENNYFDKEIQRLINDSDNNLEYCLLKNNFKLSELRIEYENIREINLYIGLLNLYQKVWTTIAGFVDISLTYKFSFGNYLREGMKYIAFRDRKVIVEKLLSSHQSYTQKKDVSLNPYLAKTNNKNGLKNPYHSKSMFIQLYYELLNEPISLYQNNGTCLRIRYQNQLGIDQSGLFRDAMTVIAGEIFHSDMNLMIPCSEELFIPNAKLSTPQYSELYRQVGRIMGISIRNRDAFNLIFPFPQFIWKLIYDPNLCLEESDISLYDRLAIEKCKEIQIRLDNNVRCEELHSKFSIKPYLGEEPTISDKAVDSCFFIITKDTKLVESFCDVRKRQFLSQVRNIHKGILDTIPDAILSTISYSELEFLICGNPVIDLPTVRANTRYDGYKESDKVIQNYWKIFEDEFSNTEKSKWLYFVTGSYRLPVDKVWKDKFTIRKYLGGTNLLPLVHTCFFVVDLPPYETYEKLKEKMLKAIEFGIFGIYNY